MGLGPIGRQLTTELGQRVHQVGGPLALDFERRELETVVVGDGVAHPAEPVRGRRDRVEVAALVGRLPARHEQHPREPEALGHLFGRAQVAEVCMTKLALEPMPALVDDMEDTANGGYSAWPDRLYLIGKDGHVAYRGGPGPFGFHPDELEDAIRAELGMD